MCLELFQAAAPLPKGRDITWPKINSGGGGCRIEKHTRETKDSGHKIGGRMLLVQK